MKDGLVLSISRILDDLDKFGLKKSNVKCSPIYHKNSVLTIYFNNRSDMNFYKLAGQYGNLPFVKTIVNKKYSKRIKIILDSTFFIKENNS